jgi:hypothetical protein
VSHFLGEQDLLTHSFPAPYGKLRLPLGSAEASGLSVAYAYGFIIVDEISPSGWKVTTVITSFPLKMGSDSRYLPTLAS